MSPSVRYVWLDREAQWVGPNGPLGYVPPPVPDRDQLVYGEYVPSDETAGVPSDATLTTVNATDSLPTSKGLIAPTSPGFWRIQQADTIVYGLDIHGCIKPEANGVVIDTCRLRGRPKIANVGANVYQPVLDMVSSLTASVPTVVIDSTISIDQPGAEQYCVKGRHIKAYRSVFEYGIDNFQLYNGPSWIYGCILRNKHFASVDPNQGPEGSHSDDVQFQGGSTSALTMIGNLIESGITPSGSSNMGLFISQDAGSAGTYDIQHNVFKTKQAGGTTVATPINIVTSSGLIAVAYNRIQKSPSGHHMLAQNTTVRSALAAQPGNTDYDTGSTTMVLSG